MYLSYYILSHNTGWSQLTCIRSKQPFSSIFKSFSISRNFSAWFLSEDASVPTGIIGSDCLYYCQIVTEKKYYIYIHFLIHFETLLTWKFHSKCCGKYDIKSYDNYQKKYCCVYGEKDSEICDESHHESLGYVSIKTLSDLRSRTVIQHNWNY